jgi:hypothetical protein
MINTAFNALVILDKKYGNAHIPFNLSSLACVPANGDAEDIKKKWSSQQV